MWCKPWSVLVERPFGPSCAGSCGTVLSTASTWCNAARLDSCNHSSFAVEKGTIHRDLELKPHSEMLFLDSKCCLLRMTLLDAAVAPVESSPKSHDITVSECQVAVQITSVVRYLSKCRFTMWDVHQEDVLVDHAGHVTFLDIFMGPCECLGPLSGTTALS